MSDPRPSQPDRKGVGIRLAKQSRRLAIVGSATAIVSYLILQPGDQYADHPTPGGSSLLSLIAWIALPLYVGAVVAIVTALVCGGLAQHKATGYAQPQRDRVLGISATGIVVGVFVGLPTICPGVIFFYFAFSCAIGSGCLTI